jgi:hypothetical protein
MIVKKSTRFYTTADGAKFPLYEAMYDYHFTIYKVDCAIAKIGDALNCLLALGIRHDKKVLAAYIGSGRDAYIIFKANPNAPHEFQHESHAVHFMIPTTAGRVRDYFDAHEGKEILALKLVAPSATQTKEAKSHYDKIRSEKIKNGEIIPAKSKQARSTRITRLGVPHRPRPIITDDNVTVPERMDNQKDGSIVDDMRAA